MKTRTNAAIKAHLIRGAFYLLLLLAVCAIPFALAQSRSRGTTKPEVANSASNPITVAKSAAAQIVSRAAEATMLSHIHPKRTSQSNAGSGLLPYDVRGVPDLPGISQFPQKTSGARAAHVIPIPRPPKAPQVVLYDQYDNPGINATVSATFTDSSMFDTDLADDFVVPDGQTWNVASIDADGSYSMCPNDVCPGATDWNVFIYADSGGLPGMQVYSTTHISISQVGTTFTADLVPAAVLSPGTYWIEIQANMTFATEGEWNWTDRTVQSNSPAAWQNPGGGFGICMNWGQRAATCGMDPAAPDQVYRINGTIGGATPSPTATATATATPTATPTCSAIATPGPWMTANPYPTTIARYGFAQTATAFYVFGGVSDGTPVNAVNRLDLATGTWESRAPMPFTSEAPTCALMESTGIVYCAEGNLGNGFASYNIATDSWTLLANTPNGDDYGSASGAFNGKVFLAGGTTGFSNAVWVYDVASNTWSAGTAAPNGYLLAGYQQVDQYLYVVGGWTDGAANSLFTTTRLDMSSAPGVWENGPSFPPGRADFGLAYDAGTNKLFAIGGDLCCDGNFFNSTNKVAELDLSVWPGGVWVHLYPDLPLPVRQSNQAGFYGNWDIWSVGGMDGATMQFLSDVYHRTTGGGCASPTPTATATATTTPTATATPRSTPTATATATATATTTPTATPVCTPIVIEGSIELTDPTQTDHLNRSGNPQTCPATTTCAIFGDGLLHHYDSYSFTNTTESTQCVNIDTNSACTGVRFIFTAAYFGSFDPNNICTNWIGDSGFSPDPDQAFQVDVPAGRTLVVVVSNVTSDGTCPGYTLTVTGLCSGFTPSPTPTATATATAVASATPTATATATPTPRPTATARPAPTPRPCPTPAPRP